MTLGMPHALFILDDCRQVVYPSIARVSGEALAGVSLTCHS